MNPENKPDAYRYGCDYGEILKEIGEIVIRDDVGDYQGDTLVLFHKGEQWGYLCFGYGSCSGCDAAQAVSSEQEAQELADGMEADVKWLDRAGMLAFMRDHDWEADWHGRDEYQKRFVARAIAALEGAV